MRPVEERTGGRHPGNLPADLTPFIGRRRLLSEARRVLTVGRLVTMTGEGGVGKTRAALQVARKVGRAFPDGVWLTDLAPLREPALLGITVADALDLRNQSSRPSLETLVEHVRDKQLLLVLDNCEHLLEACGELVDVLLRSAPGLQVLATSRQVLGLEGEHVLRVPPLDLPAPDVPAALAAQYEAVALLVDRAAAAAPEFKLTDENCASVAGLCRRLDGIPLAIELAAVRLGTMTVDEILNRLDDRFRVLADGRRRALPHQQTLGATFDWSYDLCDAQEKLLWARLSVFAGVFDLQAAEDVCSDADLDREAIFNLLSRLVGKSVVHADTVVNGRTRYRLLETSRQYALHRLTDIGAEALMRQRHFDYYQRLATRAAGDWFSPREAAWLARIRTELPNLRAALDYGIKESGLSLSALRLAVSLTQTRAWFFAGSLLEGRYWLDRALRLSEPTDPLYVEGTALAAWIRLVQGAQAEAERLLNHCRELSESIEDDLADAVVRFVQGTHAMMVDADPKALLLLSEARSSFDRAGACGNSHMASLLLAMATTFFGGRDEAFAAASACLAHAQEHEAAWAISWGIFCVGLAELRHGSAQRARTLLCDSMRRQVPLQDQWGPVWGVEALAWATSGEGDDRAAQLLGAAQSMRTSAGVTIAGLRPFGLGHAECETALRARLDEVAFTTAFNRGADMPFDRAISFALDEPSSATESGPSTVEGTVELTKRELEVAELISDGLTNKQIAAKLVISPRTAETHVRHILEKLGFGSRVQVAAWITGRSTQPKTSDTPPAS